jgi:transposase
MESIDARKVPEGLYERRKQVVRLSRKGYGPMAIAELTGLSWGAVNTALKAYGSGGLDALRPKARGRKTGTKRLLSAEQEAEVRKLICDKRPEQMKMPFALWTRAAVRQLILERFGIALAVRSVGEYLGRWGFTPQKPLKRAYEQQPEAVKAWLDTEYPRIARRAREEG